MKLVVGAVASMVVHGAILLVMSRLEPPAEPKSASVVRMEVREPPPPPPPPPPKVEEVIPEPTVVPKRVKRRTVKKVVKTVPPPPPPNARPPPPPTAFAVDMSSTVVAGKGPAVRTVDGGGNMFANPNDDTLPTGPKRTAPPPPPSGRGDGDTAPGEGYEITEEPRYAIPPAERTPPYPEEAKAAGITGRVMLRVYVDERGRVARVRVVKGLGGGCTEAAVRWARKRWRFEPARAGAEAVGMWITVPVTFTLER